MNIIAEKISTKFFSYDKESRVFTAEHSDLPRNFNFHSQVFNDACDTGFILTSEKTGKDIVFTFYKEDRNNDEDYELMGTWFEYYGNDKTLKDIKVLIIND